MVKKFLYGMFVISVPNLSGHGVDGARVEIAYDPEWEGKRKWEKLEIFRIACLRNVKFELLPESTFLKILRALCLAYFGFPIYVHMHLLFVCNVTKIGSWAAVCLLGLLSWQVSGCQKHNTPFLVLPLCVMQATLRYVYSE